MIVSNIIEINTEKLSGTNGPITAKKILYILYTTEVDVHSFHINAPLMFLSDAFKSCHEPNCYFKGEIHYTTDPDFCDYAAEHEQVAEFCKQLNTKPLAEDL